MSDFAPERLLLILECLPTPKRYLLAYSGGLDSQVLLQSIATLEGQLSIPVSVVHVNHGLHAEAAGWAEHCRQVCTQLNFELGIYSVDAQPQQGESPEAAARKARYKLFAEIMATDDMLLTAHHQDDQAETLLIQLLRGAGPHGLAAMPPIKTFAKGYHARPLLGFTRTSLFEYAQQQGYTWVHDSSNDEYIYQRNYLRHEIMPRFFQHWPAMSSTISRSASLCADAAVLLDELADEDLAGLGRGDGLAVSALLTLSPQRQRNLLRRWCVQRDLPLPAQTHLLQVQQQILAPADHMPKISWPGAEIRRYQDRLYLMSPLPEAEPGVSLDWDLSQELQLPGGCLRAVAASQNGLSEVIKDNKITVKFRAGGEQIVTESGHHHPLKKIFQEYRIPPWWRSLVPLIYVNDELAAVADIIIDKRFKAPSEMAAIGLQWQKV
jgi:tRNA(Ile)-lysidine synthase